MPSAPPIVALGFCILAVLVASGVVALLARAAGRARGPAHGRRAVLSAGTLGLLWLTVPALLARSGVLARFDARPPPLLLLVAAALAAAALVVFSRFGRELVDHTPFAWLIGLQAFRLPLELVMHRAATEGLMPIQMSFSGYNFDIVSGATALAVAVALHYRPNARGLVIAWNALGCALLVAILGIAVASMPLFRAFGADRENRLVAYFPYVWLATVLVPAALFGHLSVFRKLRRESRARLHGNERNAIHHLQTEPVDSSDLSRIIGQ